MPFYPGYRSPLCAQWQLTHASHVPGPLRPQSNPDLNPPPEFEPVDPNVPEIQPDAPPEPEVVPDRPTGPDVQPGQPGQPEIVPPQTPEPDPPAPGENPATSSSTGGARLYCFATLRRKKWGRYLLKKVEKRAYLARM